MIHGSINKKKKIDMCTDLTQYMKNKNILLYNGAIM